MRYWNKLTALAIAALCFTSCLVQEQVERRSPMRPSSSDALATSSAREFLFEVGGLQDAEEVFTIENSLLEQALQMKAVYQPMTLRFQQIDRLLVQHQQAAQASHMGNFNLAVDATVSLPHQPLPETLQVEYQGLAIHDYSLQGQVLDFSELDLDAEITTLSISYQYIQNQFQLPSIPAVDTLQVLVNSTLILPELYTISGQTIQLNFLAPANSEIRFIYREHANLLTSQVLGARTVASSIVVSYDDVTIPSSSYQFDPEIGRLDFVDIPGDGVNVTISYQFREGEQLLYDLLKRPSAFSEVKVFDQNSGEEIAIADLSSFSILFHAEDFIENRRLTIRYKGQDSIFHELRLSQEPSEGSFRSNFDKRVCLSGSGLLRKGRNILLECEFEGRSDLRFSYSFMSNRSRFPIHSVTNPEFGIWEVYLDEIKTSDWRREGNVIIIPENLPASTKVLIRHIPKLPKK